MGVGVRSMEVPRVSQSSGFCPNSGSFGGYGWSTANKAEPSLSACAWQRDHLWQLICQEGPCPGCATPPCESF